MNVLNSISDMISSVADNMASMTNSYINTGANITTQNNSSQLAIIDYNNYYNFLRDWHYTESLVSIFSTTISESLSNNDLIVKIPKAPKFCDEFNKFILDSNLRDFIINKLDNFVYRGKYSFGLDFKNHKLLALKDPYAARMVLESGTLVGYLYDNNFIRRDEMVTYYYKATDEVCINKEESKLIKSDDSNPISNYAVKYSVFDGKSIFRSQLYRLFQLYVYEYMLYYLNLRTTSKPDILGMNTGGRQANVVQALNMTNQVESLLNSTTADLASLVDPQSFINRLTFNLLNYVKIVPAVEQYQNLSNIDSAQSKLPELQSQYDSVKREVLNNLTIPEEVVSGSANRWEMMARNDRFLTTNEFFMRSITRLIKDICISYATTFKITLSYSDIEFNLDSSSMMANYDVKSKLASASDKLSDVSRILGSAKELLDNPLLDKDKIFEYIKSQIKGIDSKLSATLVESIPVTNTESTNDYQ